MRCEDYLEFLSPYLDDELALKEKTQLEDHLKECSKCQEELKNLKEVLSYLEQVEGKEVPEGFHSQLMMKINEDKKPKGSKNRVFTYLSSLAAVIILAVVFINNERISILPSETSEGMPEIAHYTLDQETGVEGVVDKSDRVRMAMPFQSAVPSQEEHTPKIIAEEAENYSDPVMMVEENWYISCIDIEQFEQLIEEFAKNNDYKIQTMQQGNTLSIHFTTEVDKELVRRAVEEAKGVTKVDIEPHQNGTLTLIIDEIVP